MTWCHERDISWDDRLRIIYVNEGNKEMAVSAPGSYAVVAKSSIPSGEIIARIPCSALFCVRYSDLAKKHAFQQALGRYASTLCLALCVLHEQEIGAVSYTHLTLPTKA